ncbi:uncharacterized protein LOC132061132 [Lycium ferocissimum]|uniref:uncharacterized protein LOC132061132 n=1 Tax=Lycium ferocissimum TaxID=112874 RepID=UPI002814A6FB|nr:uncharacterized protein LOC132061132 [Lycium ferocissimum]
MADDALPVENVFGDESDMEEDFASAIVHPRVTATTIKFETSLYHMLKQEGYFRNAVDDDPHQHITNFLEFTKLPRNSIATWEEIVKVFLRKWYPPSKRAEIRDQIYEFKQRHGEQLFKAWERYKEYLDRSPNHGFPYHILKEKLHGGLDPMTQAMTNNAAGGCFMNKSYASIADILDRLTTHSQAWHSSNSEGLSLGTPLIQNIVKDSQETQQTLAQLATNISLLTKRFDEREAKMVNVCEDISGMPPGMYQVQEGPYQEGPPPPVENVHYADYIAKRDIPGPIQRYWRPQQGQGAYNNNQGNYNNNYGGPN